MAGLSHEMSISGSSGNQPEDPDEYLKGEVQPPGGWQEPVEVPAPTPVQTGGD